MENNFPLSRYQHCFNVGKKMYKYAKEKLGWSEKKAREMFVLGNIHDIGYEFDGDKFGHDIALADCLNDYKYTNEIRYHTYFQTEYQSPEMDLLYFGDMTVNGVGKWCTFNERLADLTDRYGKDSIVVKESEDIANYLKEKGFDDSF